MGHAGPGPLPQRLGPDGHVPPAQELHALLGHDDLQHLLCLGPLQAVHGEKEHPHAVIPLTPQGDSKVPGGFYHQLVGHLEQQAHAVAGLSGGVLSGAVLQLFHDLQRVVHRLMGLSALDVHDRADAAGVVLKTGAV